MTLRRTTGRASLGLYRAAVRARAKLLSALSAGAFAEFGRHSVLEPPLRLSGEQQISVGDEVYVGGGSWLQVLPDADFTGVAIEIGSGTSIAGGCVLSAARSIRLGRKVLLARNVYVADHSHAFDNLSRAVLDQGVDRVAGVVIDDGAWLGQNVVVCPGVRIGRGAVIGANSVVLDDIPDHAIAVGAPARVVRRLTAGAESAA